jgi:hypothetical protein
MQEIMQMKKNIAKFSLALGLLGLSTPGLEATWTTPVAVSSDTLIADEPVLAVDVSGNAIALWQAYDGTDYFIQAATLPFGSSWSSVATPSSSGPSTQTPGIAVDSSGNGVAVWAFFDGTSSRIQSANLPFGGSWSTPTNISASGQDAYNPAIAMDKTGTVGNAVATWYRFDPTSSNFIVRAAGLPSGGSWGSYATLSDVTENANSSFIGIDSSGNAYAGWSQFDGSNYMVLTSTLPFGSSWTTAVTLTASGQDSFVPLGGNNPNGDLILAWSRYNGSNWIIEAANLPSGGSWSSTVDLSATGGDAIQPIVSIDSSGNAVAVWYRFDGSNWIIQAASFVSGSWSSSVDLTATGQDAFEGNVVVDSSGNATAIWTRFDGSNYVIQSATLPFGSSWSSPVSISTTGYDSFSPTLGVDSSGNVVAIWTQNTDTNPVIMSSTFAFGS